MPSPRATVRPARAAVGRLLDDKRARGLSFEPQGTRALRARTYVDSQSRSDSPLEALAPGAAWAPKNASISNSNSDVSKFNTREVARVHGPRIERSRSTASPTVRLLRRPVEPRTMINEDSFDSPMSVPMSGRSRPASEWSGRAGMAGLVRRFLYTRQGAGGGARDRGRAKRNGPTGRRRRACASCRA